MRYFCVGVFTFPSRTRGLSAILDYFYQNGDSGESLRSGVGQRLTGPVTVDSGKGLKQKKIWDFMGNKTDTYRQVRILCCLATKPPIAEVMMGRVFGGGIYPRPKVIINKSKLLRIWINTLYYLFNFQNSFNVSASCNSSPKPRGDLGTQTSSLILQSFLCYKGVCVNQDVKEWIKKVNIFEVFKGKSHVRPFPVWLTKLQPARLRKARKLLAI